MKAPQRKEENTYLVLFLLGSMILVFSLYLNVYFLCRFLMQ